MFGYFTNEPPTAFQLWLQAMMRRYMENESIRITAEMERRQWEQDEKMGKSDG